MFSLKKSFFLQSMLGSSTEEHIFFVFLVFLFYLEMSWLLLLFEQIEVQNFLLGATKLWDFLFFLINNVTKRSNILKGLHKIKSVFLSKNLECFKHINTFSCENKKCFSRSLAKLWKHGFKGNFVTCT